TLEHAACLGERRLRSNGIGRAQREDQIACLRGLALAPDDAGLAQDFFVRRRAGDQPGLFDTGQRRDRARQTHQHNRIQIGRAAHLVDDHAHATPMVSAKATSASSKHLSGALTTPAPTWPTPGSRWAMPVLMVGASPVSTTRRMSMPVGTPAKSIAGMVQ